MNQNRQTMPPPVQFVSTGLRSLILRYGMANEQEILELEELHKDCMVLESMVREGVTRASLMATIVGALRVKMVNLAQLKGIEPGLITRFDTNDAMLSRYLPYATLNNKIQVAFADPLDLETINRVKFALGNAVEVVLAAESEIVSLLSKLSNLQAIADQASQTCATNEIAQDTVVGPSSLTDTTQTDTMVRLVNEMLANAITAHVSDIHIEPESDGLHIKFRQDGTMSSYLLVPKKLQPYVTTRVKLLARMDITERKKPQDGRFRFTPSDAPPVDLRVSTVPTPSGEKIVMRLLASADETKWNYRVLGMAPAMEASLRRLLEIRDRLMIVTGPTGSGKSTTLYTSVYELLRQGRHIVTIEDPVEYKIDGITQIQIEEKNGVGFATCLRSVLRQDPEVIFIGEIRDGDTANCALKAAQTGHQVLSSLHTSTAPSAITRLIDLGCPPYVVATSAGAVISQRLVRKLCPKCSQPLPASEADIAAEKYNIPAQSLRKAVGCDRCNNTGYKGREAIFALFEVTDEMREVIRRCGSEQELRLVAATAGYRSLAYDGLQKAAQGITTIDELIYTMGAGCVEEAALEDTLVDPSAAPKETEGAPLVPWELE